jgi:DNA mismatch repair ATPase MutS
MSHHMQVDVSTLYSLQVLSQDDNPGAPSCAHVELEPLVILSFADPLTYLSTPAMLSGGSKEGLSLLSILDNTQSPLGRKLLRTWILRPLVKETDIAVRTEGVASLAKVLSLSV